MHIDEYLMRKEEACGEKKMAKNIEAHTKRKQTALYCMVRILLIVCLFGNLV